MRNSLFLNRLVVFTHERLIAYDETYHRGINIIRGDNSSGKSTITHFIFYVLGGAFNDWVKEAKKCSVVIAEVEMTGSVFVIKREINISSLTQKGNSLEPIYIYWGTYEESLSSSTNDWQKFNYNTTENKKSFSNVFFENLDIPVVKGENNITFHQILRLLYVDQDSPTSSLFLYEQFDTTLTRETVSDLLLGVYKQELYDSKQRLVDASGELDTAKREIKVLKKYIPDELDLFPEHVKTKIANRESDILAIDEQILQLREQNKVVRFTKNTKLEFEKLNVEAISQRETVNKLDEQIRTLKYEIEDTTYFIQSLESKIKAVKNSILTRAFLGEFPLDFCPECLTELKSVSNESTCKLCKEPTDKTYGVTQARKIEQELSFQIKESNSLLLLNHKQLNDANSKYESEKIKLNSLQARVNAALKDVKSMREEKIDSLFVDKGFFEGEILQLRTTLETAETYQTLVKKQKELENEINRLNLTIEKIISQQQLQKERTNRSIEKEALYLLNNDLRRQRDFIEAKEFNVDYRNNIAFISDKDARYSASSNFYLKTSARFAIFLASLDISDMRYPRFILCDNMEDKGIEEKRAQNFQRIIIAESENHDSVEYQIIYTTSFLPNELNDSEYCVGRYYTEEYPSLQNV